SLIIPGKSPTRERVWSFQLEEKQRHRNRKHSRSAGEEVRTSPPPPPPTTAAWPAVVEENETETTEDYDTGMVSTFTESRPHPQRWERRACITPLCSLQESLSSAGTPHKRDSLTYSTWLEDSSSSAST
ncbi:unnamed protein product, partial [Tetraodon nigroviridis]